MARTKDVWTYLLFVKSGLVAQAPAAAQDTIRDGVQNVSVYTPGEETRQDPNQCLEPSQMGQGQNQAELQANLTVPVLKYMPPFTRNTFWCVDETTQEF